ncbi:hypothetical protein GOODEAATRI_009852, partial [Goodea atripinnis]
LAQPGLVQVGTESTCKAHCLQDNVKCWLTPFAIHHPPNPPVVSDLAVTQQAHSICRTLRSCTPCALKSVRPFFVFGFRSISSGPPVRSDPRLS